MTLHKSYYQRLSYFLLLLIPFCDEGFAILTEIADTMDEHFSISAQRFLKYLRTNWKIRWCVVNVKNSILRTSNVLKVNFVELSDNLQYETDVLSYIWVSTIFVIKFARFPYSS